MLELPKSLRLSNRAPIVATGAIVGFAVALVFLVWITGYRQLQDNQKFIGQEAEMKVTNLAVAFEQNVTVTATDLDRLLLYLRQMRTRADDGTSWQTLVKEPYTIAEQSVQIAVMDKAGMMITSTAMLYPKEPVDLGDREHFRFHANSSADVLFISRPLVGRASGKKSVQFARRLMDSEGRFAGVVVVSLDPEYVTRTYSKLNLGTGGGLALVGSDGIVRAGTGRYLDMIGKGFREGNPAGLLSSSTQETRVERVLHDDGPKIAASRRLASFPLEVVVSIDDFRMSDAWLAAEWRFFAWSLGLTFVILAVMAAVVYWQRNADTALFQIARHDSLTGLANRLLFHSELEAEITRKDSKQGFALLLIDLDDFKLANDAFGHSVGDKLLSCVGQRLIESCRREDLVARLGGDEFAIIQRNVDGDEPAIAMAERIRTLLDEPFEIDGKSIRVGASIGVARAPQDATSSGDLINAADVALYIVKANGGHGVCRYLEKMTEALHDQRELELDLKLAVERNEFALHYQPIVSLETGDVVGFEALLRWQHRTRGLVSPAAFIPTAERTGSINAIGAWALRRACDDALGWPGDMHVAVNCSPDQFRSGTLPLAIREALRDSGLSPSRLKIEITESSLMKHDSSTLAQLTDITEMGVRLSMDDFGTGYSSLSYLQSYPFSCIKIDRSFVSSLDGPSSKHVVVSAIVQLAANLGLETVAEGIETAEQLERLRSIGCRHGQGYLFSKPVPLEQTVLLIARRSKERHAA